MLLYYWYLALIGSLSLLIGSFLNVVIVRLPIILERQTKRECELILEKTTSNPVETTNILTLAYPNSHCPQCLSPIKWYDNIPLLSYFLLKGKCRHCQQPISKRYPFIEALTCILSIFNAYHFGWTICTPFALLLTWALIVLVAIDYEHLWLPDQITLPILWLGLMINAFSLFCSPKAAITGAAAGYLILWSLYWVFKKLTGKEGLGYGDFKLLALFGAWLGIQKIPLLLFIASLIGSVIGLIYLKKTRSSLQTPLPFGPFLALGGWIMFLWGDKLNQMYWQ